MSNTKSTVKVKHRLHVIKGQRDKLEQYLTYTRDLDHRSAAKFSGLVDDQWGDDYLEKMRRELA